MMYLRPQSSGLGAAHPCQSGGSCVCGGTCRGVGLGQFAGRTRTLDPLLSTALTAAAAATASSDPGSRETWGYVRRILGAQALAPKGKKTEPGKLSDLTPTLAKITWVAENPVYAALAPLMLLMGAFALGRVTKRRRAA